MRRHLFNVLAGVSLLLAAGAVGLWVRSYARPAGLSYGGATVAPDGTAVESRDWSACWSRGSLTLSRSRTTIDGEAAVVRTWLAMFRKINHDGRSEWRVRPPIDLSAIADPGTRLPRHGFVALRERRTDLLPPIETEANGPPPGLHPCRAVSTFASVTFPLWAATAAAGILPAVWLARWRRARRSRPGGFPVADRPAKG